MGRYFQHSNFPTADFELTGAEETVPQSLFTFHSSGGVHLLGYRVYVLNGTVAAVIPSIFLLLDGATALAGNDTVQIPAGQKFMLQGLLLVEIPQGPHTLEIRATGAAAVGDLIESADGAFFAIEFPSWETADRIDV